MSTGEVSSSHRTDGLRVTAPPYRRMWQPREVPLERLLEDVLDPLKRGAALIHLATKRNTVPNFSLIVWQTPVIVTLILQEILRIYPYIHHQEQMPDDVCHRVSCAISLFQPIVIDDRVRDEFFRAEIPQYLYPFMNNPRQSASFEKLRLTSLGIIGFLVKELDSEAIECLLRSEVIKTCLRCMEVGTVLSKTVAVFILERILRTEIGLEYICDNQEQFLATNRMLASMFTLPHVISSSRPLKRKSSRLLRRVIICFCLFSCNPSVSETLYNLLPDEIRDGSYFYMFQDDAEILNSVYQLLWNLKNANTSLDMTTTTTMNLTAAMENGRIYTRGYKRILLKSNDKK